MSTKPGRNDPCWCGSGKKLKKCHGRQASGVPPQALSVAAGNPPSPILTHRGPTGEEPGLLAVRLVGHRPESVDSELQTLRSGWGGALRAAAVPSDCGCRSIGDSFGDHGERVIKALKQPPKHFASEARQLISLIGTAQEAWLDEAVAMRDRIAHHGMLPDLACFVQQPYLGGGRAEVLYPTTPNGERVRHFVDRAENHLRAFVNKFVILALQAAHHGRAVLGGRRSTVGR